MNESKVIRIACSADMDLLDKKREYNPINRRIEIIILTDAAAKKILNN
jgi:flagellar motor protein MotB